MRVWKIYYRWTVWVSTPTLNLSWQLDPLTRLLLFGTWGISSSSFIASRVIRTRSSRSNGLPIMRQSSPVQELTEGFMCGICQRSERSRVQKMLKMVLLSSCSSTVVTQPRFLISVGIPMTPGWSAACPRTTSCRCGKWPRISTMMRSQRPQHQNLTAANEEIFTTWAKISWFKPLHYLKLYLRKLL